MWFRNYYHCPGDLDYRSQHEPMEWQDEWECMGNDKCPGCNCEIEPWKSEPLEMEDIS
jgi:transcription initiation factor IIE alpha subunit